MRQATIVKAKGAVERAPPGRMVAVCHRTMVSCKRARRTEAITSLRVARLHHVITRPNIQLKGGHQWVGE